MRSFFASWLLWIACALGTSAQAQASLAGSVFRSEQSRAELLVHAPEGVAPGKPLWLGLQIEHAPDWHSYWKNSGDSGLPTELQWRLPQGVEAAGIAWPTPRKFPLGDLANYGYDGTVLLPVPVTVKPDFRGTHLDVGLYATWLICRKECIPEEANLTLRLPVDGSSALHGQAFQSALDANPKNAPAGQSTLAARDDKLQVSLQGLPADWRGRTLEFFPETAGLILPGAAWQQAWKGDTWQASIPLSPQRSDSPIDVPLVVTLANPPGKGHGLTGIAMTVPVSGGWPPVASSPSGASDALNAALARNAERAASATSTNTLSLWAALLGALIGGVILNLMPCVFPVLAIKVLAFARHGDQHATHRASGLAYTAGVVLSFLALGGVLLALRAAGEQLGWGFQLQNPAVVAALAALFTVIGLNLAGLFEFGTVLPSSLAGMQLRHPVADAFLTGVLATAVASPCTAPFMGASLGLAVALPTGQALAVFGALGLGMALPYLAASWVPAIARALPRPGAWMETFRQLMAFPMFATVVWLLWVLGQQSGIDGAAALLLLLVALTLAIWTLGRHGRTRVVLGSLSVAALAWLLWTAGPYVTRPQETATALPTSVAGVQWEVWTPQRHAELLAQGRPVFVDFTAAWCVTCQYNKRTTLANENVLQDAVGRNVALLRADWTRRDPHVTEALAQLGRNGVPTYALYSSGRPPVVLTEILSVDEVRTALGQL